MRKNTFVVLALAVLCVALLPSCNGGDTYQTTEDIQIIIEAPEDTENAFADCKHSFGVWDVIMPATCNEEGKVRRTCEKCGFTERQNSLKLGHRYVDNICDACGYINGASSLCQHTFGEWESVKEPNCITDGQIMRCCSMCGEVERLTVPKTGIHEEVTLPERASTCYMEGYTEHIYCVCCEWVFKERQYLAKLPHNYENGVCAVCGEQKN